MQYKKNKLVSKQMQHKTLQDNKRTIIHRDAIPKKMNF
jgi:hypothetical protein